MPRDKCAAPPDAVEVDSVKRCLCAGMELSLKNTESVVLWRLRNRNVILTEGRRAEAPVPKNYICSCISVSEQVMLKSLCLHCGSAPADSFQSNCIFGCANYAVSTCKSIT